MFLLLLAELAWVLYFAAAISALWNFSVFNSVSVWVCAVVQQTRNQIVEIKSDMSSPFKVSIWAMCIGLVMFSLNRLDTHSNKQTDAQVDMYMKVYNTQRARDLEIFNATHTDLALKNTNSYHNFSDRYELIKSSKFLDKSELNGVGWYNLYYDRETGKVMCLSCNKGWYEAKKGWQ